MNSTSYKVICNSDINEMQLDDVFNLINKNLMSIETLTPPFGELRSEHLVKALKMAEFFNNDEIISKIPILKKTYSLITKNQTKIDFTEQSCIDYYKSKFPNLKFNSSSWKQVESKISLETFISIDQISEEAIIIWNSLPGIRTINSCSGHYNANRYFSFSNFNIIFDKNIVDIIKISDSLKKAFSSFDSNIFKIDIDVIDNQLGIRFFQIPTIKWIAKNNKIPINKLCTEIFEQYKATFNTDSDFENFNIKKCNSTINAVEFVRKNLWKYVNQLNINLGISESEDELFWEVFRSKCLIFEETYKEYYISEKAIDNVKLFWKRIETVGLKLR